MADGKKEVDMKTMMKAANKEGGKKGQDLAGACSFASSLTRVLLLRCVAVAASRRVVRTRCVCVRRALRVISRASGGRRR